MTTKAMEMRSFAFAVGLRVKAGATLDSAIDQEFSANTRGLDAGDVEELRETLHNYERARLR